MKIIKSHVFYIETKKEEKFILKATKNYDIVHQQEEFFSVCSNPSINTFHSFPNGKKIIEGFGFYWTIVPFIEGQPLSYKNKRDREDALASIQAFHKDTSGKRVDNPLLKNPLYIKGYHRLRKLHHAKSTMKKYGYGHLYNEIFNVSQNQLKSFAQLDWGMIEKESVEQSMWIHGDVASHNFIRDEKERVHIIDFELLSLSPHLYDYIQLGQRFLPFLNQDLNKLLPYFSFQKEKMLEPLLLGIAVPTDVIRELYNFLCINRTDNQYIQYFEKLYEDWQKRIQFVQQVKNVLT